ncbi:replication initiator protein A [Staphylococcus agnetis]|uniref:replication initiator protein A n=1 Tax=Staphylococcus agnetis TaxID=985762 RepID=UPI00208F4B33|nr:replication initiator protein A [Staphylococcus agnetis]MCO4342138.1 replication initiator protein A [Staphylococcus agnetis]MCO4344243.1 replication initiator protein A [Staphylococcus agnetis]MCO4368127.1 replication initiator protein A [Staphylococcus agnetis]
MSEQRFNIQQQYRQKFYQLPKVFFTNDKYIKLSNDAKIAYALLKDRLDLSIKNNWFDENGDIFFIYTNEKLKKILNCHNAKLVKIKKELTQANLLEQIRCGQGKPNKLYLMNPEITKEDIYEIEKQEESVDEPCNDDEVRKSNFKKFDFRTSRNSKIKLQEIRKSNANDTDISDTDISDTELNDTTTTKTKTNSSGSSKEKYLIKLLKEEMSVRPTKAFIEKIADLSKDMPPDLLEYAIKYASENGNNPKQYLAKILQVWSTNHIYDLEQAQNFSVKSNIHSLKSKEKTPRWITHPEEFKLIEENDQDLAAEAQAFKEHLTKKRRNYK